MRLEQKYFIPFMLIVGGVCILLIIYFNFSFMGSQQERFLQRVDDGAALYETEYPDFFTGDSLSPAEISEGKPFIILFWSSWSNRSVEARQHLAALIEESGRNVTVLSAAVKDDADYLRDIIGDSDFGFYVADGTEIYNETRLPGLPSLVAYNPDGSLYGAQLGFRQTSDYDFLTTLFQSDESSTR